MSCPPSDTPRDPRRDEATSDGSADTPIEARDEALGRLAEQLPGSAGDAADLARRLGVGDDDLAACLAAFDGFDVALGEDLTPAVDDDALPPPELPDDYELLGELGRGGMGVVYRARQRSLDRQVAVKVLRPGELIFGDALRRFEREAQSLARLRHPHIVSVHEIGRADGLLYFTMDLIEGESLQDKLARGPLTTAQAVRMLRQVTSAIVYTHQHGFVHRDLKPGNILLDGAENALVADFGLVRNLTDGGDGTVSGHILGTPDYMSPEQARGDVNRVGEATDIYALGAVLHVSLTGRTLFPGRALVDKVQAILHEDPPAPRKLNPRVPRDLESICLKALEKNPERRYTTARALLEDLERFDEGLPIRARRPGALVRGWRFARRHVALSLAVGVALAALVLVQTVLTPFIRRSPETRLVSAEELLAEGDAASADALTTRVLVELQDEGVADDDALRVRTVACLVDARLERASEQASGGAYDQAAEMLQRTRDEADGSLDALPPIRQVRFHARRAMLLAESDRLDAGLLAFDDLLAVLVEHFPEADGSLRGQPSFGNLIRSPWRRDDPLRTDDRARIALYLDEHPRVALRWLRSADRGPTALFHDVLPQLDELSTALRSLTLGALADAIEPELDPTQVERWIETLNDATLPPATRTWAAALLAMRLDLVHDLDMLPVDAPRLGVDVDALIDVARALPGADRLEAARLRLDWAIAQRARIDAAGGDTGPVDAWLSAHAGEPPTEGWEAWWSREPSVDLVARLHEALGEPRPTADDEDLASRLTGLHETYLRATGLERERRHQLLTLLAPAELAVPVWPAHRGEPDDLPRAWAAALDTLDESLRGTVILWTVRLHPGGVPHEFSSSHETTTDLGGHHGFGFGMTRVESSVHALYSTARLPGTLGGVMARGRYLSRDASLFAGTSLPPDETRADRLIANFPFRVGSFGVSMSAQLATERESLASQLSVRVTTRGGNSDGFDTRPLGELGVFHVPADGALGGEVIGADYLITGTARLRGAETRPFHTTFTDTITATARRMVAHPERSLADLGGQRRLLAAAAWIPLPTVRDDLITIDRLRRERAQRLPPEASGLGDRPQIGSGKTPIDEALGVGGARIEASLALPARLLAGDATALDQPDVEARLDTALEALRLGNDYFARLLVHGQDARLVSLAERRLLAGDTTHATWVFLNAAAALQDLELPPAIAARARRAMSDDVARGQPLVTWSLVGTAALLLAGAGLLVFTFWPRASVRRRVGGIAGALVVGLVFTATDLNIAEADYLPTEVGALTVTLACLLLAKTVRRMRYVVPALCAAGATVLSYLVRAQQPYTQLQDVALALTILALGLVVATDARVGRGVRIVLAVATLLYGAASLPATVAWARTAAERNGLADVELLPTLPSVLPLIGLVGFVTLLASLVPAVLSGARTAPEGARA